MPGIEIGLANDPEQERKTRIGAQAPRTTSYEDEMKRIDEEIAKRQKAYGMFDSDIAGAIEAYGDSAASQESRNVYHKIHSENSGREAYDKWDEAAQGYTGYWRNRISSELADLQQKKQGALEGAIDQRLAGIRMQEEQYKKQLLGQQGQYNSAIDAQLAQQLEEAGYQGGVIRGQTGAAFADRGLGRSTMAADAIGDVTLNEQEAKAGFRTNAQQAKTRIDQGVNAAVKGIEDNRRKLEINRNLSELQGITDVNFQREANDIQNFYENQINEMKMDASKKDLWNKIGAGLIKTGVTALGGMLGGPAVGFAAGNIAGSAYEA